MHRHSSCEHIRLVAAKPRRAKYTEYKTKFCAMGVFRSARLSPRINARGLVKKSILSAKRKKPHTFASLSPGVNLLIYHHSAETETHIYFIPKMAKSFDLLGFSRQKADCFYVRRMRKLIKCLPLHEFILLFTEYLQIPCQCCRIAAHIYNPLR